MSETETDDLAWEAFQYADGQLSDADEAAFEDRLAVDQRLREAVARAAEARAAVRAAVRVVESEATVVRTATSVRPRRSVVTAVVTACVLLAVVLVVKFGTPGSNDSTDNDVALDRPHEPLVDADHTDEIVAFWADGTVPVDEADAVFEDRGLGRLLSDPGEDDREFVVPGWMLAAVEPEAMDELMETMDPHPLPQPAVEN